jgi:hypothetical protein
VESVPLALVMLGVALYCSLLLALSARYAVPPRGTLGMHVAMGAVMAGMFWSPLTLPVGATVWQVAFGAVAVAFLAAWVARRRGGRATTEHRDHGVGAAAMAFMHTPTSWAPAAAVDVLAVGLSAYLVLVATHSTGHALSGARELVARRPRPGAVGCLVAPVWPRCCEAAMAATMALLVFFTVR